MALQKKENFLFAGLVILIVFTLPLAISENIDCKGKAFYCVNSTHFKICVDLGGGVSTTVDDFLIPCPRNTACKDDNHFECEYQVPTTFASIAHSDVTNEAFELSDTTIFDNLEGTTTFPEYKSNKLEELRNDQNSTKLTTELEYTSSPTNVVNNSLTLSDIILKPVNISSEINFINVNNSDDIVNSATVSSTHISYDLMTATNDLSTTTDNVISNDIVTEDTLIKSHLNSYDNTPQTLLYDVTESVYTSSNPTILYSENYINDKLKESNIPFDFETTSLRTEKNMNVIISETDNIVALNDTDINLTTRANVQNMNEENSLLELSVSTKTLNLTVTTDKHSLLNLVTENYNPQESNDQYKSVKDFNHTDYKNTTFPPNFSNKNRLDVTQTINIFEIANTTENVNLTPLINFENNTLVQSSVSKNILNSTFTTETNGLMDDYLQTEVTSNTYPSTINLNSVNYNDNLSTPVDNNKNQLDETKSIPSNMSEILSTTEISKTYIESRYKINSVNSSTSLSENNGINPNYYNNLINITTVHKTEDLPLATINKNDTDRNYDDILPRIISNQNQFGTTISISTDILETVNVTETSNIPLTTSFTFVDSSIMPLVFNETQRVSNKSPEKNAVNNIDDYLLGPITEKLLNEESRNFSLNNLSTDEQPFDFHSLDLSTSATNLYKSQPNSETNLAENSTRDVNLFVTEKYLEEASTKFTEIYNTETKSPYISDIVDSSTFKPFDYEKYINRESVLQNKAEDTNKNIFRANLSLYDSILFTKENKTEKKMRDDSIGTPEHKLQINSENLYIENGAATDNPVENISELGSKLGTNVGVAPTEDLTNDRQVVDSKIKLNFTPTYQHPSTNPVTEIQNTHTESYYTAEYYKQLEKNNYFSNPSSNLNMSNSINEIIVNATINKPLEPGLISKSVGIVNEDFKIINTTNELTDAAIVTEPTKNSSTSDKIQNNNINRNFSTTNGLHIDEAKNVFLTNTDLANNNIINKKYIITPQILKPQFADKIIANNNSSAKINNTEMEMMEGNTTNDKNLDSTQSIAESKTTLRSFETSSSNYLSLQSTTYSNNDLINENIEHSTQSGPDDYFTEYTSMKNIMTSESLSNISKEITSGTNDTELKNNVNTIINDYKEKNVPSLQITTINSYQNIENSNLKQEHISEDPLHIDSWLNSSELVTVTPNETSKSISNIKSNVSNTNVQGSENQYILFNVSSYSLINKTKINSLEEYVSSNFSIPIGLIKLDANIKLNMVKDKMVNDSSSLLMDLNDYISTTNKNLSQINENNLIKRNTSQIITSEFTDNKQQLVEHTIINIPDEIPVRNISLRQFKSGDTNSRVLKLVSASSLKNDSVLKENISYPESFKISLNNTKLEYNTTLNNVKLDTVIINSNINKFMPPKHSIAQNNKQYSQSSNIESLNKNESNFNLSNIVNSTHPMKHNELNQFNCKNRNRGRYVDENDCNKYYICIGKHDPIVGMCPISTVFSGVKKQCTKNLSHCIRNNEFKCSSAGRFIDILSERFYYICVKKLNGYVRYKFQCQKGYRLNKTNIQCIFNPAPIDASKNQSDQSTYERKSSESTQSSNKDNDFKCVEEGKFEYSDDCKKYYSCTKTNTSEFRQKIKKCDSDKVFNKEKGKCVDADSYEC